MKELSLDPDIREILTQRIITTLESAVQESIAQLRGSLADGTADIYSDIDLVWEVPDHLFPAAVDGIGDILSEAHPVASLRSAPEFQRSDKRRLFFVQFLGIPLFWRADIEVYAQSIQRDPGYDQGNEAARGDNWSLTHSALMNAIAAVKALLRKEEGVAMELLIRGYKRLGLAIPEGDPQELVLMLAEGVSTLDATKAGLADKIVEICQDAFNER